MPENRVRSARFTDTVPENRQVDSFTDTVPENRQVDSFTDTVPENRQVDSFTDKSACKQTGRVKSTCFTDKSACKCKQTGR